MINSAVRLHFHMEVYVTYSRNPDGTKDSGTCGGLSFMLVLSFHVLFTYQGIPSFVSAIIETEFRNFNVFFVENPCGFVDKVFHIISSLHLYAFCLY